VTGAAVGVLAVAIALVRAPSPVSARLRVVCGSAGRTGPRRPSIPGTRTGIVVPAIGGAVALGVWSRLGFGTALPVLPATDRGRRRLAGRLVESVGTLAGDLRAGQQPAEALAACEGSAVGEHPAVRAVWAVSERSGAPAAAVLDRVEQDMRTRAAQQREIAAQLAGARSTAGLLSILPILGIGLGAAMGARPLAVLLGDARGQLALVAGVMLDALGVAWTARIVATAQGSR
jgi:tight adherence protein B